MVAKLCFLICFHSEISSPVHCVTLTLATAFVSGRRTPKWFKGFQACATLSMILVVAALAVCLALENVAQKKMLRIVGVVVQGLAGVLPRFPAHSQIYIPFHRFPVYCISFC